MNRADHLLVLLIEECAEVQQRATKALRFGLSEVQPGQKLTNGERLGEELADLVAVHQLIQNGELIPQIRSEQVRAKIQKIEAFAAYSRSLGRLHDGPCWECDQAKP